MTNNIFNMNKMVRVHCTPHESLPIINTLF
jgi:hypothetical protein